MIQRWKARFWANVTEAWLWVFSGAVVCIALLGLSHIVQADPITDGMFQYLAIGVLIMWIAGTSATVRTFKARHAGREVIVEVFFFVVGACVVIGAVVVILVLMLFRAWYLLYLLGF